MLFTKDLNIQKPNRAQQKKKKSVLGYIFLLRRIQHLCDKQALTGANIQEMFKLDLKLPSKSLSHRM